MNTFILAAIFAMAATILGLVSNIGLINERIWFRLGNTFNATIRQGTLNLIVIVIACILIVTVLVVAIGPIHRRGTALYGVAEWVQSQQFLGMIFGLLFGIFLVFWIRQLLMLGEKDSVTWLHKGEAIFIILLLVLGAFSDQISSFAQRLTQFSAGGVTLTFEATKGTSGVDRGQSGEGGTLVQPGTSGGALDLLSDINGDEDGVLARDHRYIQKILDLDSSELSTKNAKAPSTTSAVAYQDPSKEFFNETIGLTAECLNSVLNETRDSGEVNGVLIRLRPAIRELMVNQELLSSSRIRPIAESFINVSIDLVKDIGRTYLRRRDPAGATNQNIIQSCQHLIVSRCEAQSIVSTQGASREDVNREAEYLIHIIEGCNTDASKQIDHLANTIARVLVRSLFDRPYMALSYACLLWRIGEYELAVTVLEDWTKRPAAPEQYRERQWYNVRIRTTLTVIMEDWIRASGNPPPLLLVHHLANSEKTMELLDKLPALTEAWKLVTNPNFDVAKQGFEVPAWSDICPLNKDQFTFVITFLKQLMVYAYRATQHPEYFDAYAYDVFPAQKKMMTVDLSCLDIQNKQQAILLYAEMLQVYGEVEVANGVRIAKLPDLDAARLRFKNAAKAAKLGLHMVTDLAEKQRMAAQDSLAIVAGNQKATELKYLLDSLGQRAQEAASH
jgi:hypothetical protein